MDNLSNLIDNFNRQDQKTRHFIIFLAVLVIFSFIFCLNFFRWNHEAKTSDKAVVENINAVNSFDFSDVKKVEQEFKDMNSYDPSASTDSEKAKYQEKFQQSVVLGDSITEGLSIYGWLNSDQVFCKVGASVLAGDSMFKKAAATYPEYAFFCFGMNDMGNYRGDEKEFIKKYKKLLTGFQKKSPKTKLFVNSISTPTKAARKKNKSIRNYKKFNKAIESMCSEMKIPYIDNSAILKEHPDLYAGDGIHVDTTYYPYWLDNMIKAADL